MGIGWSLDGQLVFGLAVGPWMGSWSLNRQLVLGAAIGPWMGSWSLEQQLVLGWAVGSWSSSWSLDGQLIKLEGMKEKTTLPSVLWLACCEQPPIN